MGGTLLKINGWKYMEHNDIINMSNLDTNFCHALKIAIVFKFYMWVAPFLIVLQVHAKAFRSHATETGGRQCGGRGGCFLSVAA